MPSVSPVIVVHGIQGSWLKDQYPVDYQNSILWTGIMKKNFRALHLHPLDSTVDADVTRLTMPHQAVPLIYESLVDEIREELEDVHPYVYVFTYDWRKDNRLAAEELGVFADRVLEIAAVHEKAKNPRARKPSRITLIGHSMGGLVIKWYATKVLGVSAGKRIDRIITIATPYRGSLKAVEALLPGARNLFGIENQKSMRHAARTMPGIYQLLPTWSKAVVGRRDGKPMNIFDVKTWQTSLTSAMRDRYGSAFFSKMLGDARAFSASAQRPWPESLRKRVFTACGVDTETWWQVPVDRQSGNFFHFDEVRTDHEHSDLNGGDGTVHCVSSLRDELPARNRRLDRKEFKDAIAGHHANMPNHGSVQDWVLDILKVHPHADAAFDSPL